MNRAGPNKFDMACFARIAGFFGRHNFYVANDMTNFFFCTIAQPRTYPLLYIKTPSWTLRLDPVLKCAAPPLGLPRDCDK